MIEEQIEEDMEVFTMFNVAKIVNIDLTLG